ncbi:hypothetical protein L0F63_006435, partial [Massospora cicadina]
FILGSTVFGHMEIHTPNPRRSQYSKYYLQRGDVDWDLNAPSGSEAGFTYPYPCRGSPRGPAHGSYAPGQTINVTFVKVHSSNIHNGGHCQFGLSYDNAKTIVVIHTVLRRCFLDGLTFPVTIPTTAAPSDKVTLTWTWINAEGNREYYMNCVDIKISGNNHNGYITGPANLVANLPGYPIFPEFYLGDCHELFSNRTIITIRP